MSIAKMRDWVSIRSVGPGLVEHMMRDGLAEFDAVVAERDAAVKRAKALEESLSFAREAVAAMEVVLNDLAQRLGVSARPKEPEMLADAIETLRDAQVALLALSRHVEREFSHGRGWLPDHACARCVPHSDMILDGFACARHGALDVIGAMPEVSP